jgi:predicted CXXCH cytochrome family protein
VKASRHALGSGPVLLALLTLAPSGCAGRSDPEPATHVGRAACAPCHAPEAERWEGSHHDLAMQEASEETVLGDFDDATFVHGDVTSTFFRRGGGYRVRTDGPDGTLREYPVAYTFGVTPLQQYLIPVGEGRYQVLGIAWDARSEREGGQRWFHLYPEDVDASSPLHWTRPAQGWNARCASCHSTGLKRGFDAASRSYRTTWSEIDVSCEACHGPGSEHVRLAREASAGEAVAERNPAGLLVRLVDRDRVWTRAPGVATASRATGPPPRVEVETCAPCHARRAALGDHMPGEPLLDAFRPSLLRQDLYYADGQIEDEVYVYGSFLQSRMYAAGVTCSDCHDPHGLDTKAEGNALCTRCHDGARYDTRSHHFHDEGFEGARCVECHMPATTYMVVDPRRDHSLRIPRPDLSRAMGTPNACNRCHVDRSAAWAAETTLRWYGPPEDRNDFARALHDGRAGDPAAFAPLTALTRDAAAPPIVRGTALSLLGHYLRQGTMQALQSGLADPEPLVRLGALEGLEGFGDVSALSLAYPLLTDSLRAVRVEAARLMARVPPEGTTPEQAAAIAKGVAEYERVQRSNADQPAAWVALGDLYAAGGRAGDAEAAYRTALSLDSTDVVAYLNLADLQRALGRDDLGEEVLLRALALLPDVPEVHHALGLLLVRRGDLKDALPRLERAAERSDVARFAYVYGVALASAGDMEGGVRVLQGALALHPFDREILGALATYARDLGRTDDAVHYAQRLMVVVPEDPGPRALVEELAGAVR